MVNRSDSANELRPSGISQGFSVDGFTPINRSANLRSSLVVSGEELPTSDPKNKASRQRKANASAKRKSESRKGILDPSPQLTETQPAELFELQKALFAANTSRSAKRRRTTTQENPKSNFKDIGASLKRIKSSSHLSLTSDEAFPSLTSTSLPSPSNIFQHSKDDSSPALSNTPVSKTFSFMYHQPMNEKSSNRNSIDSRRDSSVDGKHVLASNSYVNEGSLDITVPADQRIRDLAVSPEVTRVFVTNHVPADQMSNVSSLSIDEDALFKELYSFERAPEFIAKDLDVFTDYSIIEDFSTSGKEFPSDPMDVMDGYEMPETLSDIDLLLEIQLPVQPKDDYDTNVNDEEWKAVNGTTHEVTDNIDTSVEFVRCTPHARNLNQGTDEFDTILDDEDLNTLYEGFEGLLGEEARDNPAGNPLLDDVNLFSEPDEFEDGLGDEDWNAVYDAHTAGSSVPTLQLPFLEQLHEEITGCLRDNSNFSPIAAYETRTGLDTIPKPLTGISMGVGDVDEGDEFDNDFDEEVLLQAEADLIGSGDHTNDECDIDESFLLQAELRASTPLPTRNTCIQEPPISPYPTSVSSRTRNETSNLGSKQDHSTEGLNNLQVPSTELGLGKIPSSRMSIITTSPSSSPSPTLSKPAPMPRVTHEMPPFVRRPFPAPVTKRSMIYGASNKTMLRVCFRVGEIFKAGSSQRSSDTTVLIEFYAAVIHSRRCGSLQEFHFADLFFPTRPPFIQGIYEGWNGAEPHDHDSSRFLDTSPVRMKMCRAVGRLTRSVTGKLTLNIMNIWEASWDDVRWVRGIVSP